MLFIERCTLVLAIDTEAVGKCSLISLTALRSSTRIREVSVLSRNSQSQLDSRYFWLMFFDLREALLIQLLRLLIFLFSLVKLGILFAWLVPSTQTRVQLFLRAIHVIVLFIVVIEA